MVHLTNEKTKEETWIHNDGLKIILDALEHEMQRYHNANDVIGFSACNAKNAILDALGEIRVIHSRICTMLNDDEE